MRKVSLLIIACFTTICTACTTSELTTEPVDVAVGESRLPLSVIGTWRGVIPCADCPGINYNLSLNENNTFEETMVYQDRDAAPFTRSGSWRIYNGMLELSGSDTVHTRFDLSTAGELYMLDQQGKRITTNLADRYKLYKDNLTAEDNTTLWNERRKLGIDFVATGNEPGWALEIDLEKGIYFKTLPSETIAIDTDVLQPQVKGKTTTYYSTKDGEELIVELTEQPCEDNMSGKVSPYTVRVTAKGIEFNGCGLYLNTTPEKE